MDQHYVNLQMLDKKRLKDVGWNEKLIQPFSFPFILKIAGCFSLLRKIQVGLS